MSALTALIDAAQAEFFRGMSPIDKGILRASRQRDRADLTAEDYDYAAAALKKMLRAEWANVEAGRVQDETDESKAWALADGHSLEDLRGKIIGTTHRADEFTGNGTRRTSAATQNEGNRSAFGANRIIERAIEIKEAGQ